ncbi:g3255 [Coccomyxa elongata]
MATRSGAHEEGQMAPSVMGRCVAAAAGIAAVTVALAAPTFAASPAASWDEARNSANGVAAGVSAKAGEVFSRFGTKGQDMRQNPAAPLDSLPALPYATDALEPYVDKETMEVHYNRHHQTYVTNLIKALEKAPQLKEMDLNELQRAIGTGKVPQDVKGAVRNHGGGHWNHSFFWKVMAPTKSGEANFDKAASAELKTAISNNFGSVEDFKRKFGDAALSVFGSGWTWLGLDPQGDLVITTTPNQDNPLMEGLVAQTHSPLLGLDILKHQNKKPEYIKDWWNVVNWGQVSQNYDLAKAGRKAPGATTAGREEVDR